MVFQGKRWRLSRLGFGISSAPMVMKKVLSMALGQDQRIASATSPYVDDIFVNEDVATAAEVKDHLERHDLVCKTPESV